MVVRHQTSGKHRVRLARCSREAVQKPAVARGVSVACQALLEHVDHKLVRQQLPFPGVRHIDMFEESVAFEMSAR